MKVTKISPAGLALIKFFEGFRGTAYKCQAGVPTIGYGTTRYPNGNKVQMTDTTDLGNAELYLLNDVKQFELAVDAYCTDALNQNQFDALVSFCYNLGAKNLKDSTLLKLVNQNPNDPAIKKEFLRWNKAAGKVIDGLTRRRTDEATLYFKKP